MGSNQLGVRPEDDFLDLSKVSESGVSSKESAIEIHSRGAVAV